MQMFLSILEALLEGGVVTVTVTLFSLVMAIALGFGLAVLKKYSGSSTVELAIDAYGEVLRNIPAITHLFIIYFGLAAIGLRIASIPAAILGLGLIGSAVICDIFCSGFSALGKGQREAALVTGLTPLQCIWFILAPQALRIALPPIGNYALQLLKDTSIVSAIAAPEIMFQARSMVTSSFQTTLIYVTAAAIYLALSLPVVSTVKALELRLSVGRR